MRRSPLLLVLALLLAARVSAAQSIRGNLVDAETGKPVEAGSVLLLERDSTRLAAEAVRTDSAGGFLLTAAKPGPYRLRAERLGYRSSVSPPLVLTEGDTLDVEFRLSTQVVMLKPIVVRGRKHPVFLSAFYQRAEKGGFGKYVMREQIERQNPRVTTDILRRIPGILLHPSRTGIGNAISVRGGCSPTIWVDGVRVRLFDQTVDEIVLPGELEGIEVYRGGADLPVEYGGVTGGCAAIVFWTRRG
jgi:hypothetical protein